MKAISMKKRVRNACITFNNPTGALDTSDPRIKYVVWQLEKVSCPHYQIYVEFNTQVTGSQIVKIWPGCSFRDERFGTQAQCIAYCTKAESRVEGPWEFGEKSTQGARSDIAAVTDFIKSSSNPSFDDICDEFPEFVIKYPNGIRTLLKSIAERRSNPMELTLREWQAQLVTELDGPVNDRKIIWFHDAPGNSGKTMVARYLIRNKGAFYTRNGKSADIAHAYNGQRIVVIDYTRSTETHVNYEILEALKDGVIWSPKYDSQTKVFECPHVVCMANFMPDLDKLSKDRWDIRDPLLLRSGGNTVPPLLSTSEHISSVDDIEVLAPLALRNKSGALGLTGPSRAPAQSRGASPRATEAPPPSAGVTASISCESPNRSSRAFYERLDQKTALSSLPLLQESGSSLSPLGRSAPEALPSATELHSHPKGCRCYPLGRTLVQSLLRWERCSSATGSSHNADDGSAT